MARIVHFGKYYSPESGGIETATKCFAGGAVSAGHTVTVICFSKNNIKNDDTIDGVHIIRAPIAKLVASQPLGLKYLFFCLKAAKGADIIHLHAPNFLAAFCALLIHKKRHLLVHWHSDVVNKGLLGIIIRPLESALLKRANCIVVTSQEYAEASNVLTAYRNKIKVVPIGISDVKQNSDSLQLPSEIEKKVAGKKIILAVGRLVSYKGFDVIIRAANDINSGAIIVIAGSGPLQHDLQMSIDLGGLSERVLLTGHVSDEVLHSLYSHAALYCLPSINRAEAFGVVLLEAMAHALPVVSSNIPGSGVSWVNKNGSSGLNVPVEDSEALAKACNQILNSNVLSTRFSRGARERFISEFTEQVAVQRMLAVYKFLLMP